MTRPYSSQTSPSKAEKTRSDKHYKIKQGTFIFSVDDCFELTMTVEKIDREAFRLANKQYALGKGQSKHEYKHSHKGKPDKTVAYSECTGRNLYKNLHSFINWAYKSKKIRPGMRLCDLVPLIQSYLDDKARTCTPNTVHTYAAYLCKGFKLEMGDYTYPARCRADVVLHRKDDEYFFAMLGKYPELVRFCLATGLRKYKELGRLTGSALRKQSGEFVLLVEGKGGYKRLAPILGCGAELVARLCRTAGDRLVFPRLPGELDVHMLRAMYASDIYLKNARDISALSHKEKYFCRSDYQGIVLDRRAMEIASKAIGHKRVGVIAQSYLWPIIDYLRGGALATPMRMLLDGSLGL